MTDGGGTGAEVAAWRGMRAAEEDGGCGRKNADEGVFERDDEVER
jgi:hypothetical protein